MRIPVRSVRLGGENCEVVRHISDVYRYMKGSTNNNGKQDVTAYSCQGYREPNFGFLEFILRM